MDDKTINLNELVDKKKDIEIAEILKIVYHNLKEKNYNPYDQIGGYLLTGDPSYIPRYKDSRKLLKSKSRDDILLYLLRNNLNNE